MKDSFSNLDKIAFFIDRQAKKKDEKKKTQERKIRMKRRREMFC